MRAGRDPVRFEDGHAAVGGDDDHVTVAYGLLDPGDGACGEAQFVGSPAGEALGALDMTGRHDDVRDLPDLAHRPQLGPRLGTGAHHAERDGFGSGEGVDGHGADGARPPRAQLRAVHQGAQIAVVGAPHGHELFGVGAGDVRTETEDALLTEASGGEDQMASADVGAHARWRVEGAFVSGQYRRPYGAYGGRRVEPGADIVIVEQQRRHRQRISCRKSRHSGGGTPSK